MHRNPPEDGSISTAVIGVGYLGKFHADKYAVLPGATLFGVVDSDTENAKAVAEQHNVRSFSDFRDVIGHVEAVSIASTTSSHFEIAKECLQAGIHVLVEKPMTVTIAEADELVELAERQSCVLQVGHIQRFHPALLDLDNVLKQPVFIETHRLAPFNPRGTDVNVVLDLMIHDIDIVLNLVDSDVESIAASGARVLSDSVDIANVRLNFKNKCVANITASRVSQKTERKMRIFQQNECLSVDLFEHRLSRYYRDDCMGENKLPEIRSTIQSYENNDALMVQIESFLDCVRNQKSPLVSGTDGRRALATAIDISRLIDSESSGS